eukprot:TRINITY_DN24923_c0_g1_i1.p1 TRINITY_DN24923_c0_g1~~TRINITY_DN24923_c0_g1_i1.p1  ORF type:complete len:131 (+),score=4.09 TRINITY_DN24923_c0_g1_i1:26-394(+)
MEERAVDERLRIDCDATPTTLDPACIPPEVMVLIFACIRDLKGLYRCHLVCRYWKYVLDCNPQLFWYQHNPPVVLIRSPSRRSRKDPTIAYLLARSCGIVIVERSCPVRTCQPRDEFCYLLE